MTKIRVVIFIGTFRVGGSERQAVRLAKFLNRAQFDPIIACFQKDGALLDELPRDLSGPVVYPLKGFLSASCLRQSVGFFRFLRGIQPHVVQCFDFYSNAFAIPLARLAGVPVVLGACREGSPTKTQTQRTLQRMCYRLATGVVANAEAMKDQVVKQDELSPHRVWVIHNGSDLSSYVHFGRTSSASNRGCSGDIRIGVVANLRSEKGHLILLDAAQQLANRLPRVSFAFAGSGPMEHEIELRIKELSLSQRVQLLGYVRDIPGFLRNIDIAVLPSSSEAFPNAVMEAMAASLPVVATDTGGTRELVVDGETGFLVPPNDSAALADRIGRLCSQPAVRLMMGEAGRRRVTEQFSADRMARRFEDLYWELLKGRMARELVTGEKVDSPLWDLIENHAAQK